MDAIKIKHLRKCFRSNFYFRKIPVLRDINLQVRSGEIYGFLGPNGAGKTTTIKCLLNLIHYDSGEIEILGKNSRHIGIRGEIGYLPEHPYFYPHLTAEELLRFYAHLFSIPISRNRIQDLIRKVGLEGKGKIKLQKYSKGMIQRIGIAQSIINDPRIVILDEPFSGLDPIGRKDLRDLILELRDEGKTVFFSSHILHDIEALVNRVGIIFNGVTLKEGRISEMVEKTAHSHEILFTLPGGTSPDSLGLKIQQKDNKFFVKVGNEEKDRFISRVIASRGRILSVSPNRMTLENIFLEEIQK